MDRQSSSRVAGPDNAQGANVSALIGGTQIDTERQHAVLDRRFSVTDDREVLEIQLRLPQERLPLLPRHRREWPLLHRRGALAKSLDHLVRVEGGHGPTLVAGH